MRKSAKCVLAALLTLCFAGNVNAAECSYEKQVKLGEIASTVKATYEEVEIDTGETFTALEDTSEFKAGENVKVIKPGFKVSIYNLTKDIGIKVSNDYNNTTKYYYYSDTNNGTLSLEPIVADDIVNYTIKIFAFTDDCSGIELITTNVVTPYYNRYSEYAICEEYPEYEYCQKFLSTKTDIDVKKLYEGAKSYSETLEKKENSKKKEKSFSQFINDNKKTIIITASSIIVVALVAGTIIVIHRKKRLV